MIETRPALSTELDQVRSIRAQSFVTLREVYRPLPNALPVDAASDPLLYDLIAFISGRAAGVVGISQRSMDMRVSGLAVLPEFRNRQVATALLEHAHRLAQDSGCGVLRLFTIGETGNIPIFERLGFECVAETVADWCVSDRFDTLHDVEMIKRC